MLMTAMHMEDSTHGHGPSSSSPVTSPPPWLPVLADHHQHRLLDDFQTSAPSPSPSPSPSPTIATAAPSHHHLRHAAPSSRRVAKRRPRPSRRLPTTYISADPASFRRMVHQVTGADDLPLPMPPPEVLCRPVPARAGAAGPGALMLPTLDTSAFLVGTAGGPARAEAPCDGSIAFMAAPAPALTVGADGAGEAYNNSAASSCGFPTLESWDALF